jgi:hypothetical protein
MNAALPGELREEPASHAAARGGAASDRPGAGGAGGALGPLSSQQVRELQRAAERLRRLRGATTLARVNGASLMVCAALCLPFAMLDASLLLVGMVLGVFGAVELWGGQRMRALDAGAPRVLALNQLAIFVVVALYCAVQIHGGLSGPSPYEAMTSAYPELGELTANGGAPDAEALGDSVDGIYRVAIVVFYLLLLAGAGAYLGVCAAYYLSRRRALTEYLDQTPAWVRELARRLKW